MGRLALLVYSLSFFISPSLTLLLNVKGGLFAGASPFYMELIPGLGVHENRKAACVPQFLFSIRAVDQFKEVSLDFGIC